ncbi:MAG: hypothetical protein PWQ25_1711 [Deferribacteres bacterium]|nr:hypothetical protein [Deferribacteres bacterium]
MLFTLKNSNRKNIRKSKKLLKLIILSLLLLLDIVYLNTKANADTIQDFYNASKNYKNQSVIEGLEQKTPNYDPNCVSDTCPKSQEDADKFLNYGMELTDPCTVNIYRETKTLVCDNRTEIVCDVHSASGYVFGRSSCEAWYGLTKVVGDGNKLKFYLNSTYKGAITVEGCTFSGSASYYTCYGDSCSGTSWGLSGVKATGDQLIFYGGNCGKEVGRINLGGGCRFEASGGAGGLDLTKVEVKNDTLYFYRGYSGDSLIMTVKLCTDREHTYTTCNYQITRENITQ